MFLTVGLLVAVAGMRLVFPVVIVAVSAGLSFGSVVNLALNHPSEYSGHLAAAHPAIAAFGAIFLLMIFLDFLLDATRKVHWIALIERPFGRAGQLKTLSTLMALIALAIMAAGLPAGERGAVLSSGVVGMICYLLIHGASWWFEASGRLGAQAASGAVAPKVSGQAALALFVYLEVVDASFSFDGVVGAFAVTGNVLVIALGLGVGALFVRELTVWLVRNNALTQLRYLEHGAYYAVGALAGLLIASLFTDLPEVVTGLSGSLIIGASVVASLLERRSSAARSAT
jgi:hypothetical protein